MSDITAAQDQNNWIDNIAFTCVDQFCEQGLADETAMQWAAEDGKVADITYGSLGDLSNQTANILRDLGIQKGEVVSLFLPNSVDLVSAFFAILKLEAAACVLFSTFGETALLDRLSDSQTRLIITSKSLMTRLGKVIPLLPNLKHVLVADADGELPQNFMSLPRLMAQASAKFNYARTVDRETPAFIQYTSGSTGKSKGALHVHQSIASITSSFKEVFDLKAGEKYWCTADPAWITGLVYGVIAPLACRARQTHFSGNFSSQKWLSFLEEQAVNVWYTAPTALRMLMREDAALFKTFDFSALDRIYSVGEPLNPEIYHWGRQVFGCEIYDNWFQSETGSIMISNSPRHAVRPGSMGKPLSTTKASIRADNGAPVKDGSQGNLCLASGWPSMFRAYLNKDALYREKFKGDLYFSGDLAWRDADGYIWYVSRADDVINTGGHLVGPFEVESALLEMEAITDVAVIGAPDEALHEKIVAFICLKQPYSWDRRLELNCRVRISNSVSTFAVPQEFVIVDKIPKNKSGKILRRVLKAVYAGEDPGDLSTIEE